MLIFRISTSRRCKERKISTQMMTSLCVKSNRPKGWASAGAIVSFCSDATPCKKGAMAGWPFYARGDESNDLVVLVRTALVRLPTWST